MNITNVKSLVFTETNAIDMQIEVNGEWLPFTASPLDAEAHGRDLYDRAIAGEFGEITAYTKAILPKSTATLEAILATEKMQTPRRVREAILEIADKLEIECKFLRDIESEISIKRLDLR